MSQKGALSLSLSTLLVLEFVFYHRFEFSSAKYWSIKIFETKLANKEKLSPSRKNVKENRKPFGHILCFCNIKIAT